MDFQTAQHDLNRRFTYRADKGEYWRVLKGWGAVEGDCEDYSLTLIWLSEGRSMLRFWIALITFKYLIWRCTSPGGGGHAVLWTRGIGWTDNIQRRVVPNRKELRALGYRLWFPNVFPLVALKFLFRPLLKRS